MQTLKAEAVVYVEDSPRLELTAEEWIFPIKTADDQWKILFHVKPYRPFEVKRFYDLMMIRKKQRGSSEQVWQAPNFAPLKKFVDEHFIRMSGVSTEDHQEPSIEQQKEWLDANDDFKVRIFREGYDGASTVPQEESVSANGNGHKAVLLFSTKEHQVQCDWTFYSQEREQDEKIRFVHHLDRLTQADKQRYNSAIHLIENTRKGERYVQANWDVVEQLYDQKVVKVSGLLVKGEPCEGGNIDKWKPLVPFCMKVLVMGQVLNEIDIKNG